MSILLSQDLWLFLAGISIFLYGLKLIEDICSGGSSTIQKLIQKGTNTKGKSILSGVGLISVLQSTHAVSLLILAFVGGGLVSIVHGVSMVIGMNIGSVFLQALIGFFGLGFDIGVMVLPFIAVGGLGFIFSKKYRNTFAITLGLGLLFFGLDMMKDSVDVFSSMIDITKYLSYPLIVYFFVGLIGTMATQSSQVIIIILMTAVYQGLLPLEVACMGVMGAYVGTTTTALFVSMTGDALKKQVALSHFGFNLILTIVFSIIFPWIISLISDVRGFGSNADWIGSLTKSTTNGVVIFFILFRGVGMLIFIPFIDLYTRLIQRIIPYIDQNKLNIENINKEVSIDLQRDLFHKDWIKFQQDILDFNANIINDPIAFDLQDYKDLKSRFNRLFSFISNFDYKAIKKDLDYIEKHILNPMTELIQSAKGMKDTYNDLLELYNNKDKDDHYKFIKDSYNKAVTIIDDDKKNEDQLDDIISDMDNYESNLIVTEMKGPTKLYPDLGIVMHTFNTMEQSLSNLISAFQDISNTKK